MSPAASARHDDLTELVPLPQVWQRMERVEERLLEATRSEDGFLTEIAQHLLGAGGKRYRPLLALVAGELGPAPVEGPIEAAVAVELVHLGSLYHDDVIDEAETRRTKASVNANWSNTVAILAGDFVLARASEVAAPLGAEAVALLARTYATLCEGQILELQLQDRLDQAREDYFRVIGGKTAALLRTSARLGALAAGAERDVVEAVSAWAWEMGLVFQMTDDVLDLVADDAFLGKPSGSDILEGTFTLAVLEGLDGPRGDELRALLEGGHPYEQATVRRVIDLLVGGGDIDRVLAEAEQRLRVADKSLDGLPPGPIRDTLYELGQFLLARVSAARAVS